MIISHSKKWILGVALCLGVQLYAQQETDSTEVKTPAQQAIDEAVEAVEKAADALKEAADEAKEDRAEVQEVREAIEEVAYEPKDFDPNDTLHLNDSSFSGLEFLNDILADYKVFITGENHLFRKSNAQLWLKMIKYLHSKGAARNVMFEYGHSYGFLVNEYLQTGDSLLLESIDNFSSDEYYEVFKELRAFNETLPETDKIYFAGIDLDRGVYPIAKALEYLLPDENKPVPDSISLNIGSIRSLADYNDYKLNEQGQIKAYMSSGFQFKTNSTLDLVHADFMKHKAYYKTYLGADYSAFQQIIEDEYLARKQWMEYESSGAIQEYIYRENYMYRRFLVEHAAHEGGWFGQFGRCHTTQDTQENNSCEWFKFRSLAQRIKNDANLDLNNAVMTIALVYRSDRNFGPDKKLTHDMFEDYFDDMTDNTIALLDLKSDSSLSSNFSEDFNFLFLSTHGEQSYYSNYNSNTYSDDIYVKLQGGFSQHFIDMNALNMRFSDAGGASNVFSNQRNVAELSYSILTEGVTTDFIFGLYLKQEEKVGDLTYAFTGKSFKFNVSYDLFKKTRWIELKPGVGYGLTSFNLTTTETIDQTPDLAQAELGEFRIHDYENNAFILDGSVALQFNLSWVTIGGVAGYIWDVSNPHWKSGDELLELSPETSFSGLYRGVRLGFNF